MTTAVVSTPKGDLSVSRNQEENQSYKGEGSWTAQNKQGKSRTLLKDYFEEPKAIPCENGYGVLGELNDPLILDRGPC